MLEISEQEQYHILRDNLVLRISYDVDKETAARIIDSVNYTPVLLTQNVSWLGYDLPWLAAGLHQSDEYYFEGMEWQPEASQPPVTPQPCFVGIHPPELVPVIMAMLMNGESSDRPLRVMVTEMPDDHFKFARKLTKGQYLEILAALAADDLGYEEIMKRLKP
jgi:hypothetical protein